MYSVAFICFVIITGKSFVGGVKKSSAKAYHTAKEDVKKRKEQAVIRKVHDYCLGYKLPGAGGGGYLYMIAKDPEASASIRNILTAYAPNNCARFVDMTLSNKGFQVSRS